MLFFSSPVQKCITLSPILRLFHVFFNSSKKVYNFCVTVRYHSLNGKWIIPLSTIKLKDLGQYEDRVRMLTRYQYMTFLMTRRSVYLCPVYGVCRYKSQFYCCKRRFPNVHDGLWHVNVIWGLYGIYIVDKSTRGTLRLNRLDKPASGFGHGYVVTNISRKRCNY